VLYARLHGHPSLADVILTDHLPSLLTAWQWEDGATPVWWFVRYRHPMPHLRLRLRTDAYGWAADRLGTWAAELRHHGLINRLVLDTDLPEFGRYGHGTAMAAAEELFAADSAAAIAQLYAPPAKQQAVTAASLVNLASAVMGSRGVGLLWLLDHRDIASRETVDRQAVREAVALEIPGGPALRDLPGGDRIAVAWRRRTQAAANYVHQLAADDSHATPETVLGSLLHLHHVRVHGVEHDREAATYRVARAVALAAEARRGQHP
jgi:thiopeptide-type bacteriocin biosynthesis protein